MSLSLIALRSREQESECLGECGVGLESWELGRHPVLALQTNNGRPVLGPGNLS